MAVFPVGRENWKGDEKVYLKHIISEAEKWIAAYIISFHNEDKAAMWGIRLKEAHIGFVRRHCKELAQWLQLNEHDALLAELIGLLHDVGRFRQWSEYRTFRDNLSEDHAELGLKVIKEQSLYRALNSEDRSILLFAISNHNKKFIAPAPSERHLLFAKIIRDADKLDIYRVNIDYVCVPPEGVFAPVCKKNFLLAEQINGGDMQTVDDRKLLYLVWVYDLYYSWTMKKIVEKGYLERVAASLPRDAEVEKAVERLKSYIINQEHQK